MPNYFSDKYGYADDSPDKEGGVQDPALSINNEQGQEPAIQADTALPDTGPLPGNYYVDRYGYDDEPIPEAPDIPADEDPTWQDYGRMVMGGAASIGSGVGWLMEKMGAEEIGGAVRERSEESRKAWMEDSLDVIGLEEKGLSEQARKALATEFLGEGSYGDKWDKAKLTAAASLMGTMAGMGLGGVLTKGLTSVGVGGRTAAAVGYGTGEAGVAAPTAGAATDDEVKAMPHEQLMGSLEYQAAYEAMSNLEEGERQAKAKQLVADAAAGKAAALTLLSTFVLSAPFSQTMAKLTAGVPSPGGRVAGAVTGGAEEATQEFLQSGAEQLSTNIAIQQEADPTRKLGADVLEQAVGGAMAGGIMGTPAGFAAGGVEAPEQPGPMADLERQQQEARDRTAAEGGDALEQELAAAQAGVAPGAAIDAETENRNRLERMQELIDQEAAYADTQVQEDEARAKIQAEAAQRYEQGIQQIEQDTKAAQDKAQLAETVGAKQAEIEKADVTTAEEQAAAKAEAARKTRAAEKADNQLRKLRKRRQELGLEPKEDVGGTSGLPSEKEVAAFKGERAPNRAMAEALVSAANEAATSTQNDLPEPTEAQIDAGNYKKGHVKVQGFDITIENPSGSTRKGVSRQGVAWSQKMRDHYGYIKGTESAEGPAEQLDVFLGDAPESQSVFVVDQIDQTTGNFDEHKVMMGYANQLAAVRAYKRNYSKGWKVGPVTEMPLADFKDWVNKGDTTKPVKPIAGTTPASAEQLEEVIQAKTRKGGRRPRILYRLGEEGNSKRLSTEIKERGGFTVDNKTGQPKTDGYAVGIGAEEIIEGDATPEQIEDYRKRHAEELARPDHYLGAWKDEGKTYLDVSMVHPDTPTGRTAAMAHGMKNEELAIMDLTRGEVIPLQAEEVEAAPAPEEAPETFKEKSMFISTLDKVPGDPQRKSPKEMVEFTKKVESGEIKPVIIVETVNGKPVRIKEGNHTIRALKALGKKIVPVRLQDVGTGTGRDFKDFFASVTQGVTGVSSTGAPYQPVITSAANELQKPNSPLSKFSQEYSKHRGNFDDHIAFSIPGFKEVQQMVGRGLVANYGTGDSLLDIGASEGSFVKAVSALSGMNTVALDPNPAMAETFKTTSKVKGSEYAMSALGAAEEAGQVAWVEDGVDIKYYDPKGKKFDVVHEAMVFQFISSDRKNQIARTKELMKEDGLLIVEQKLFTDNQAANEKKKNEYKGQFFEKKDLDAKSAEVLEGMHANMVHHRELESTLLDNFNHVVQFWSSGNFKGYMASDSKEAVDKMVASTGDTTSEFSTEATPNDINEERILYRRGEGPVGMSRAEAEETVGPMATKLPLMQPIILGSPLDAPAEMRQQMEDDGALGAKGVYDPVSDKLYVFSENHTNPDDLERTILHEGVAHKGLRYLLGERTTDVLRSVFANGERAGIAATARRYSLDLNNPADQLIAAEEYIASIAESGIESGVFAQVMAAIRQALRDLGLVTKWTDSDIRGLLRNARSSLRGKSLSRVTISTEVEIEETGEVVTLEEPGDVALRQMDKRMNMVEKLRTCIG